MKSLSHQFLDYCRTRPRDEAYDYFSSRSGRSGCAITQFTHDTGLPWEAYFKMDGWDNPAGRAAITRPWTFGALADRLERELARGPQIDDVPVVALRRRSWLARILGR